METLDIAGVIGGRVRDRHLERGWTLDQLAERSWVSRRMVVDVDQGAATRASPRCCGAATRSASGRPRWSRSSDPVRCA